MIKLSHLFFISLPPLNAFFPPTHLVDKLEKGVLRDSKPRAGGLGWGMGFEPRGTEWEGQGGWMIE